MNKDNVGFTQIKKFKIIKKETYDSIDYDYRLELEELYKTGTVSSKKSLKFFSKK